MSACMSIHRHKGAARDFSVAALWPSVPRHSACPYTCLYTRLYARLHTCLHTCLYTCLYTCPYTAAMPPPAMACVCARTLECRVDLVRPERLVPKTDDTPAWNHSLDLRTDIAMSKWKHHVHARLHACLYTGTKELREAISVGGLQGVGTMPIEQVRTHVCTRVSTHVYTPVYAHVYTPVYAHVYALHVSCSQD